MRMIDSTPQAAAPTLDLSRVDDPETRRALRAVHQAMADTMARQQMEIEALVEVLMEKHLTSIGEFRRHMQRLQQKDARCVRLHDQLMSPTPPPATAKSAIH